MDCEKQLDVTPDQLKCDICSKVFLAKVSLEMHIQHHFEERLRRCHLCQMEVPYKQLAAHMRSEHPGEHPCTCDVCTKAVFEKHLTEEDGTDTGKDGLDRCHHCPASFTRKCALLEHLFRHTVEHRHECDRCPVIYTASTEPNRPTMVHAGEWLYKCDKCSAAFLRYRILARHVQSAHPNPPSVQCAVCQMSFKTVQSLLHHARIHTPGYPHTCPNCKISLNSATVLKKHVRTHHGVPKFPCNVCSMTFPFSYMLKVHRRSHTKKPNATSEGAELISIRDIRRSPRVMLAQMKASAKAIHARASQSDAT